MCAVHEGDCRGRVALSPWSENQVVAEPEFGVGTKSKSSESVANAVLLGHPPPNEDFFFLKSRDRVEIRVCMQQISWGVDGVLPISQVPRLQAPATTALSCAPVSNQPNRAINSEVQVSTMDNVPQSCYSNLDHGLPEVKIA